VVVRFFALFDVDFLAVVRAFDFAAVEAFVCADMPPAPASPAAAHHSAPLWKIHAL